MNNKAFIGILMLFSSHAVAGPFLQAGLHFGGDELASARYESGFDVDIEAGGLVSLSAGYNIIFTESFETRLSVGMKFDDISAENGSAEFNRYPLTAMVFYGGNEFKVGAGVTRHTGVVFKGDGVLATQTVDFSDATGSVFELDYIFNNNAYMSLLFTNIEYKVPGYSGSLDGNSVGVLFGFRFES